MSARGLCPAGQDAHGGDIGSVRGWKGVTKGDSLHGQVWAGGLVDDEHGLESDEMELKQLAASLGVPPMAHGNESNDARHGAEDLDATESVTEEWGSEEEAMDARQQQLLAKGAQMLGLKLPTEATDEEAQADKEKFVRALAAQLSPADKVKA